MALAVVGKPDPNPWAVVGSANELYASGFQRCFQRNHGALSCTFRFFVLFDALDRSQRQSALRGQFGR